MSYTEREFVTDFNRWLKIIFRRTGAFELKAMKGNSIPFSAVKEHQTQALFHVKRGGLVYKIPDDAYAQKPFDCFSLINAPAYVVIMFNTKSPYFYMIDVDVWLDEAQKSERKSLTEERAAKIGSKYDLKGSLPYTHTLRDGVVGVR